MDDIVSPEFERKFKFDDAKKVFRALKEPMGWLYTRWADEREYEDFTDYSLPIRPILARNKAAFVRMTKRPFAVVFSLGDYKYSVKVTAKSMSLSEVLK